MDNIIKPFSIGLFFRSTLAGAFFLLSFGCATTSIFDISTAIAIAVFSGSAIYCCHRALTYPLIECWFDSNRSKKARQKWPLIREVTIQRIITRWSWSSEKAGMKAIIFSHTSTWADYTHFLYSATLAVITGAIAACLIEGTFLPPSIPLIALTFFLGLAGFVSDWRLHSFHDAVFEHYKP